MITSELREALRRTRANKVFHTATGIIALDAGERGIFPLRVLSCSRPRSANANR